MNLLNELAKILKKGSIYDAANFLRSCSYDEFLVKQILVKSNPEKWSGSEIDSILKLEKTKTKRKRTNTDVHQFYI